jgi:hypothetical protein
MHFVQAWGACTSPGLARPLRIVAAVGRVAKLRSLSATSESCGLAASFRIFAEVE